MKKRNNSSKPIIYIKSKQNKKKLKNNSMGKMDFVFENDGKVKNPLPSVKSKMVVKKSETKAKMIITDLFLDKVKFLCSKISAVEWSGILFYTYTGHISDPSNFVITPVDILLMDKGTQASTSFEITPEVLDIYDLRPELEEAKMGMIHSHNSMGKYFS